MESGDGMGGLSIAIAIAGFLLVAVPAIVLGAVAWWATRGPRRTWRKLAMMLGVFAGLVLGRIALAMTFGDSDPARDNTFTFVVPDGFDGGVIALVDDPAGQSIAWEGVALPFQGRSATVTVPASGIVRLRDVQAFTGHAREARLSDGRRMDGLRIVTDTSIGPWVALVQFEGAPPPSVSEGSAEEHLDRLLRRP